MHRISTAFPNKTGRKEQKSLANIKKVTLQGGDYY